MITYWPLRGMRQEYQKYLAFVLALPCNTGLSLACSSCGDGQVAIRCKQPTAPDAAHPCGTTLCRICWTNETFESTVKTVVDATSDTTFICREHKDKDVYRHQLASNLFGHIIVAQPPTASQHRLENAAFNSIVKLLTPGVKTPVKSATRHFKGNVLELVTVHPSHSAESVVKKVVNAARAMASLEVLRYVVINVFMQNHPTRTDRVALGKTLTLDMQDLIQHLSASVTSLPVLVTLWNPCIVPSEIAVIANLVKSFPKFTVIAFTRKVPLVTALAAVEMLDQRLPTIKSSSGPDIDVGAILATSVGDYQPILFRDGTVGKLC